MLSGLSVTRLRRCEYLFRKKIYYVIENPSSTLLFSYAPIKETRLKTVGSLYELRGIDGLNRIFAKRG